MRELDRLNLFFEVSLYALVSLPIAMIAIGGSLPWFLGVLFALAIPASWFDRRRGNQSKHRSTMWNLIMLAFLTVTGAQLFLTEMSLLDGGIRFVVVLTMIRLFARYSEREELQLYALSFLGVAAATTVNEDVTFGLLFGVYVLLGTFSLAVFHLRSELAARPRLALGEQQPSLNRGYFAVLMGMGGFILAASLTIFFAFPRIGLGFFAPQERDGISMAGFSDNVELGGHGAIRDNPQVVMRVEFPDGNVPDYSGIHWRVMSFDHYDGRRWKQTLSYTRALRMDDGVSDLSRVFNSKGPGQKLQIYLEPIGKNLLPTVRPTHSARLGVTDYVLKWGPRAGYLRRDYYDDIHHTIESELGTAYILTLATGVEPRPGGARPAHEAFMQLPTLTPRVKQLAQQMTAGATTHKEKADAIKRGLGQYAYTTDLPPVDGDPVDAFLFETKRGHCEYFATSTVMLLRESGVPARLVNGFLGGKWNDVGGYLAVRQGDAHSWAEYWDPIYGWTQIDATPASAGDEASSLLDTARETLDSLRLRWVKWVIEYDLNAQIDVFRKAMGVLRAGGSSEQEDTRVAVKTERTANWRAALLLGGLATLLFAAFHRTRRRRRRHDGPVRTGFTMVVFVGAGAAFAGWFEGFTGPTMIWGACFPVFGVIAAFVDHRLANPASIAQLFDLIERSAMKTDGPRQTGEGPAEYLTRLSIAHPSCATELDRFAKHYLRARFGDEPEPDELERLRAAAHRIADKIRQS